VALSSVEWRIIENYLAEIIAAVNGAIPGAFRAVECGTFNRRKNIDG
jgi:hypothetical protein